MLEPYHLNFLNVLYRGPLPRGVILNFTCTWSIFFLVLLFVGCFYFYFFFFIFTYSIETGFPKTLARNSHSSRYANSFLILEFSRAILKRNLPFNASLLFDHIYLRKIESSTELILRSFNA